MQADDKDITEWLQHHDFTIEEFNGAIYLLTNNKFKNWQKLPPDQKRYFVDPEYLKRIEEIIEGRNIR